MKIIVTNFSTNIALNVKNINKLIFKLNYLFNLKMDKTVENHLNRIENIKCKLSDMEYKELIESLRDIHKIKDLQNKPRLYKVLCAYPKFYNSNITFSHTSDENDEYDDGLLNLYGKVDCCIETIIIYVDFKKLIENNLDKMFLECISRKTIYLYTLKDYISNVETDVNITCVLQVIKDFDNDIIPDTSTGEFNIKINQLKIIEYEVIY